ncbi:Glycolipid transfer protein B [Holothuria leucospilota]|uniref:Glycolipid transfer protein B n=1 Tax=Holothuria leucospilota TaxID=206669 RepID=A0A9Q1HB99_HOLLE|nr:Glycolipid transfer protein B [Holothuria leucospilota]
MTDDKPKRSFHGQLETNYKAVPDDGRIETLNFLDASQVSVIPLIDMLGSTAFVFVKSDVNGNISKLRKRYEENPERFKTLHDMVEDEIEREKTDAKNSATDALIWLVRGLYFICSFVQSISKHDPSKENIQPCLQQAYTKALKVHHNWIVQKTIGVSFKAAPYYSDLIKLLSNGVDREILLEDINNYATVLEENIIAIDKFYSSKGLKEKPLA